MYLFERLAEEKIQQAIDAGELDNLPGAGQPIPDEPDRYSVAAELRMGYRIMKNAGFVPEELQIRREIVQLTQLLGQCGNGGTTSRKNRNRINLLVQRLGEMRGVDLLTQDIYFRRILKCMAGG